MKKYLMRKAKLSISGSHSTSPEERSSSMSSTPSNATASKASTSRSNLRERLSREVDQISEWTPQQCCKKNCTGKIGVEGCRNLRTKFLSASQTQRKSKLLSMRTQISSQGQAQDAITVGGGKFVIASSGVFLCTRFLVSVLNVHSNLASSVLRRPSALSSDIPGRQVNSSSNGTFETSIVAFLHTLADEVGDEMPNSLERHLPHRSKKLVYMLYCESARSRNQPFSTMSHFYRAWKTLAPQIKCRKSHSFAVCDTCVSFRERLTQISGKASRDRERETLLTGFRTHLHEVKLERAIYAQNRFRAIERPGEVLSVIIDGADQSKFGIPRFLEKSKSESGHSMKQKLTGVIFHGGLGKEEFLAYLTSPDNLPSGANQTIDAFCRCYLVLLERRAFKPNLERPKTLYIQLDNTSKDNKNRFFMAFCEWLVHHGIFETIHVNFLPVGHTHEDVDRKFSRVSVALACTDTITIKDLHRAIKQSVLSDNKPHVARVRGHNNFSGALQSQGCVVKSVPRFTTYRKFVFQRESVVDMRCTDISYFVSSHAATSMTVPKADWTKLEKRDDHIGSFLVRDIDIHKMPPTLYTKMSVHEIKQLRKRVQSVEWRIRNRKKFDELLACIESIESSTTALPEWTLEQILKCANRLQDVAIFSVDSESDDEQTYSVGNMVTVRHRKRNEATPFWVGAISRVELGAQNTLEVNWFEILPEAVSKNLDVENAGPEHRRRESCYTARYRPCLLNDSERLCDEISTKSILVLFEKLTASNTLPILVQKLTRQSLDPFAEYSGGSTSDDDEGKPDGAQEEHAPGNESDNIVDDRNPSNKHVSDEDIIQPHLREATNDTSRERRSTLERTGEKRRRLRRRSKRNKPKGREGNMLRGNNGATEISPEHLKTRRFVAVNCPRTKDRDPFWIAQIRDECVALSEKADHVNVTWFSPKLISRPWSISSYSASEFTKTTHEDCIPVGSIFWSFAALTSKNKIPEMDISSIERELHEN